MTCNYHNQYMKLTCGKPLEGACPLKASDNDKCDLAKLELKNMGEVVGAASMKTKMLW